ncbi:MAG: ferredoxin reductase [Ktedonobacterales bacterium]
MAVQLPRLVWQRATVRALIQEAPQVKSLVLDVPNWEGHRAGQHLDVRLTAQDGYQVERSYSIASAPAEPRVTLTVERLDDGEVSPYLTDELRPGDELELRGPIGGWFTWRPEDGGPLLLVAGGSGIAPLMAIIRQRAAVRSPVPVCLLYSSRSYEDIIYREELDRRAAADADLDVAYTLTRSQPAGWQGYRRRIDRAMLEEVGWTPAERPLVFVCGPTPLVESAATACVELGYTPGRIKTERFGPTGGVA